MTPKSVLESAQFDKPLIISPDVFKSFDELYEVKEMIRDMKLVAVKDDYTYKLYHSYDKLKLIEHINHMMKNQDITILSDMFPNWLPNDVVQRLIWIKPNVTEERVLKFVQNILIEEKCNRFILFERPVCSAKLIKGSLSEIRHLHLWTPCEK